MRRLVAVLSIFVLTVPSLVGGQTAPSIAERTEGLERVDGFIPFYWDRARGEVLFELTRLGEDVLYYVSIAHGLGSVELSLDRGVAHQAAIRFERSGSRVHVVEQNLDYRALTEDPNIQENVQRSFAFSVLAALPIEAEEGGRLLVNATPLFIRDATDVTGHLRERNQGAFRLDPDRSGIFRERTKAFPKNTEVEVTLTFASDDPGPLVRRVTPDGRSITLRLHHSFLEAPTGYRPRRADPRIGVSSLEFKNYAAPFDRDLEVRWVRRWRLEKKDPEAAVSEPVEPIVYYLDLAIPEPIRSAMREGVLWWNRAFEAAGFRNAIEVRDPSPDMDPMDIRYAFILWVNRDERGFSSGGGITDPRTGEILGATTRMDSHRIRTISHYWQGYQPTDDDGCGMFLPLYEHLLPALQAPAASISPGEREMVLARQAVLAAHEIGHTLGFGHNWNSSINDRASVMEYPTPRVRVTSEGELDLSEAYETDVGAYDVFMARYNYTPLSPEREEEGLEAIVDEMRNEGILYTPSTDPRWSWYDDLSSPLDYLRESFAARDVMLERYGPSILRPGEPIGELRDMRFWMVYLHHRWAIEHGLDYIGGMYHNRVVRGDDLSEIPPTLIVPADLQREILGWIMEAIEPENLAIPESLLANLAPSPYGPDKEDMMEGYAFDHLRAARILAAMVLEDLLQPDRAARLIAFADRQENALTLPGVLDRLLTHTWRADREQAPVARSLRRVAERVALDSMMILGASSDATPEVRAVVLQALSELEGEIAALQSDDPVTEAHYRQAGRDLARYLEDPAANAPRSAGPDWGRRPRSRYPLPPGPPLAGPRY